MDAGVIEREECAVEDRLRAGGGRDGAVILEPQFTRVDLERAGKRHRRGQDRCSSAVFDQRAGADQRAVPRRGMPIGLEAASAAVDQATGRPVSAQDDGLRGGGVEVEVAAVAESRITIDVEKAGDPICRTGVGIDGVEFVDHADAAEPDATSSADRLVELPARAAGIIQYAVGSGFDGAIEGQSARAGVGEGRRGAGGRATKTNGATCGTQGRIGGKVHRAFVDAQPAGEGIRAAERERAAAIFRHAAAVVGHERCAGADIDRGIAVEAARAGAVEDAAIGAAEAQRAASRRPCRRN